MEVRMEKTLYPRIIAGAMADHCPKMNQRVASLEDYESLLARFT
jgi:4-hydroxybutyrate dehydrogenase